MSKCCVSRIQVFGSVSLQVSALMFGSLPHLIIGGRAAGKRDDGDPRPLGDLTDVPFVQDQPQAPPREVWLQLLHPGEHA